MYEEESSRRCIQRPRTPQPLCTASNSACTCRAAARARRAPTCSTRSSSYRHDGEKLAAGTVDHGPAFVVLAGAQPRAFGRGETDHAPLHLAAVLRTRDDLLAWVAALAEVDPAQRFEIHHLRHELVLRRCAD